MPNRTRITGLAALLPAVIVAASALPPASAVPGALAGHGRPAPAGAGLDGHPWIGLAPAGVDVDGHPWVGGAPDEVTLAGHPWAG